MFPKIVFDCQYFQKTKLFILPIYLESLSQNYKSLQKYRVDLDMTEDLVILKGFFNSILCQCKLVIIQ